LRAFCKASDFHGIVKPPMGGKKYMADELRQSTKYSLTPTQWNIVTKEVLTLASQITNIKSEPKKEPTAKKAKAQSQS
jgi:hypothetical protein